MKRISLAHGGITWTAGVAVAMAFAFVFSTVAGAQSPGMRSMDDAYPEDPSSSAAGAAAGGSCLYVRSSDDLFNKGDAAGYPGAFSVAPGASLVLDDADGSLGTFIDGENAQISERRGGGIAVAVTGNPINVGGGNGELNSTVCDSIVASTGISALTGGAGGSAGGAALSVLPDTGGSALVVYLGALTVAAGGLVLLRLRALRGR